MLRSFTIERRLRDTVALLHVDNTVKIATLHLMNKGMSVHAGEPNADATYDEAFSPELADLWFDKLAPFGDDMVTHMFHLDVHAVRVRRDTLIARCMLAEEKRKADAAFKVLLDAPMAG